MAEQEPYEEGEIAEVERDLDRLETPDETTTEQIDADEDEIGGSSGLDSAPKLKRRH